MSTEKMNDGEWWATGVLQALGAASAEPAEFLNALTNIGTQLEIANLFRALESYPAGDATVHLTRRKAAEIHQRALDMLEPDPGGR